MNDISMRRVREWQPLSRDHGLVLVCAQYGRKAIRASKDDRLKLAAQMRAMCKDVIAPNLEDEQWILSPVIGDSRLREEFHQRHKSIIELAQQLCRIDLSEDPGVGLVSRVANALDDYVRWQENTLYPRIFDGMNKDTLRQLATITSAMEAGRHRPTQRLHQSVALQRPSGLPN